MTNSRIQNQYPHPAVFSHLTTASSAPGAATGSVRRPIPQPVFSASGR